MKWYGRRQSIEFQKNLVRNYKRRLNLRSRNLSLIINPRVGYRKGFVAIHVPSIWKITYIKNFNCPYLFILKLFNDTYFCNISIPVRWATYYCDPQSRSFSFAFSRKNHYFKLYWFTFFFVFNALSQIFFNKLRFRGKGHYVYKNRRQTIAFQFGYSHRVRTYLYFVSVKFLSKVSVLIFGLNKFDIIKASYLFFNKRPINIFTGKGVRFTRQVIYRKAGKISSYR